MIMHIPHPKGGSMGSEATIAPTGAPGMRDRNIINEVVIINEVAVGSGGIYMHHQQEINFIDSWLVVVSRRLDRNVLY